MSHIPDPLEQLLRGTRAAGDSGSNPPQPPQPLTRKTKGCLGAALLISVLMFVGPGAIQFYCDWLWYVHDGAQPEVFFKQWQIQIVLWVIGFAVSFLVIGLNLSKALRHPVDPNFIPASPEEKIQADILKFSSQRHRLVSGLIASLFGLFFASLLASRAPEWMWSRGATEFGVKDPLFGRDLGFFVFQLPWTQSIFAYVFLLLLVTTGLVGFSHFIVERATRQLRGFRASTAGRAQTGVLAGLTFLALGAQQWVGQFNRVSTEGAQFTGPGYAGTQALVMHQALAVLMAVVGLWCILNSFSGKPFQALRWGSITVVLFAVAGLGLYPILIQRIYVEPNRLNVESPFAQRAIKMTRYAYRLDAIRVANFSVNPEPTSAEVQASTSTLANMRLWDPNILRDSVDGLQSIRPYYTFNDVDIDRYTIQGKQQMVMLAPRDMDVRGLTPSAQTWINTRLQYTHGYGLVMSPVNQATSTGQPVFLAKDFPPKMPPGLKLDQPRIYFSDFQPASQEASSYVIVKTKQEEFDFPGQTGTETYRWTGSRGVPVGGAFSRLMHSLRFRDGNLLVSSNITPDSRILYHRSILDRASKVYRWLLLDQDPYLVVSQGRLKWIVDAYTTTDKIPYSASIRWGGKSVNYVRNSVKIVVDAYTGEMNAYAYDENEPILRAYRKLYPKLFLPKSQFPKELIPHVRYGEDFFSAQANVLTQYHVTDPASFLNNEDAWEIPTEIGRAGTSSTLLPYYVQIRLPDEERDSFMLILPFTPRQKNNMIGWMAAHCDPEKYGQTVLYKFPKDSQTPGPNQVESLINQNPTVAEINRELNNDQSMIIPGNLLVIPLGTSILYVKPLFLQSRSSGIQPIPELKKVVLALRDRVVVRDSYSEALRELMGDAPEEPAPSTPAAGSTAQSPPKNPEGPAPDVPARALRLAREALRLMDQADQALRKGDLGAYGELNRQARERLRQLEREAAP